MAFESELSQINEYIESFNPDEFSTSSTIEIYNEPNQNHLNFVNRFKARSQRKKIMEESFVKAMESGDLDHSDIQITQEQIDALLATQ